MAIGASPLLTSFRALGIGAGDEVIVPSFGPSSPADAVRDAGASPVFADVDARTFCLAPEAVAAAITPRTAAVVPVHLFGHPAPMRKLAALARQYGLALVEDGERDDDEAVAGRRAVARYFDSALTGVVVPYVEPGAHHLYHQYTVRIPGNGRPDRDAFAKALSARGVRTTVSIPTPVHRTPSYRAPAHLPETERAAGETLTLPLQEPFDQEGLERIAQACNALGGLLR